MWPDRQDIAKAPKEAWSRQLRSGFRHELASTLSLFAVLQRYAPTHPALMGPWRELLIHAGIPPDAITDSEIQPNPLEQEIIDLNADHFNLMAYLVCAHHGKLRVTWHACPADLSSSDGLPRIRGLCDGDTLPPLVLADRKHSMHNLPSIRLDLAPSSAGLNSRTGPGWTERILTLLEHYGPFALAWLETLLRTADQRTSSCSVHDELLNPEVTP